MATKRQTTIWDNVSMPDENWCWTVEYHLADDPQGHWRLCRAPNHFRRECDAVERAEGLAQEFLDARQKGLVLFRVEPKYIGYVPDEDEAWIK